MRGGVRHGRIGGGSGARTPRDGLHADIPCGGAPGTGHPRYRPDLRSIPRRTSMAPNRNAANTPGGRTLAQWYCLLGGAAMLLAGIAGFIADASFGTGDSLDRGNLIVFDVNGWHNIVHVGSGLLLLAAGNTAPTARFVAIAFGVVYGLVTIIGLADGNDVLGIIPIDGPDNILHLLLTLLGLAAGFMSPNTRRVRGNSSSGGRSSGRAERSDADGTPPTGYAHEGQRDAASVSSTDRRR